MQKIQASFHTFPYFPNAPGQTEHAKDILITYAVTCANRRVGGFIGIVVADYIYISHCC